MKKTLIITMLLTVVCVNLSCQNKNTDKQLAKDLIGTWEGSIYIDDEEFPVDYQFFESTDGTTGNFIEIAYLHEIDGDFDIRYFAYVSGEYKVKDGQLSLTFFPESTYADPYDEDALAEYAAVLWEYYQEEGRRLLWEDQSELAVAVLETLEETWSNVCESRNQEGNDYSKLTITENELSFVAGDRTLQFTRTDHEWFTAFPFSE